MKKFGKKVGSLFSSKKGQSSAAMISAQLVDIEAKIAQMSDNELIAGAFASCAGKNADLLIYLNAMRNRDIDIVHLENEDHDTLPGAACNNPFDGTVKFLLEQPEFENYSVDSLGRTLLMRAAAAGQPAPIRGCLRTDNKENIGKAMIVAIEGDHANVLANLLNHYGIPEYRLFEDDDGLNPICHALKVISYEAKSRLNNYGDCLVLTVNTDEHCNLFQPTQRGIIPITCLPGFNSDPAASLALLSDCDKYAYDQKPIDILRKQTKAALKSTDKEVKKVAKKCRAAFSKMDERATHAASTTKTPAVLAIS